MAKQSRRGFLQSSAAGAIAPLLASPRLARSDSAPESERRYRFVQIDVFAAERLQGNPLAVFPDARGLSDDEMQAIARETNLQETTFVFPRDRASEPEHAVKVRIFIPTQEIPFGGHPTLGTAMVLRNRRFKQSGTEILLDLKVGKILVAFIKDSRGRDFGEMHQADPVFGRIHDRQAVAAAIGVNASDISEKWPIQSISTGLQFTIVPLKTLNVLKNLKIDQSKIRSYFEHDSALSDFYYVTGDTQDPVVGLRSRAIYPDGEDPATGSAAGCAAAWMVRYGVAQSGQTVQIQQGAEIKRPSQIYVRADKAGDKVTNVCVGGNAIEIAEGEYRL